MLRTVQDIDSFFVTHSHSSKGNIKFSSLHQMAGKGFCLFMYDISSISSDIEEFYGKNLSECIEKAQVWIDGLMQEDRNDREDVAMEQEEENTI